MMAMTYFMLSPRGEAGVGVCSPCPSQMQGVGVGGHAHLGHIQAHGLLVARHADALELVLGPEEGVHETKGPRHDDSDRDQLGGELPDAAPVEEAAHGAGDTVEAVAVGAVGEEPEGDETPQPVDTVYGDGAHRVVHLEPAFDEDDGDDHEQAGHQACLLYTSPSPRDRTRSRMPS